MRFLKVILISATLFLFLLSGNIFAKPVIAFGYMHNIANDREFNYLEFIFPNSFANSINAIFDVNVKKPSDLEKELSEKKKSLQKNYEYYELPDFIKEIKSDIFIFGNFTPTVKNQIKIVLNIYIKGYNEVFTFTNTGKMETQISRIIDRISIIIINFMSEQNLYKVRKILPGTRLSILSNLEGEELNSLLVAFMEKGYPVSCFQNNQLKNIIDDDTIEKFKYITTVKNSYDIITDWRKTQFYHTTASGIEYRKSVNNVKSLYKDYDLNYDSVKGETLDRISEAFNDRIDILLIIGFSGNRKTSWVRAIDIKEKELIWMQSNIKSGIISFDPIMTNVNKIVDSMIAEPLNPFKKHDEPAQIKK